MHSNSQIVYNHKNYPDKALSTKSAKPLGTEKKFKSPRPRVHSWEPPKLLPENI